MPKTNAQNVAKYYKHHKAIVLYRKMMARCRKTGAIPQASSMKLYQIPLPALLTAFGEWAAFCQRYGMSGCKKLRKQAAKLDRLKVQLRAAEASGDPLSQSSDPGGLNHWLSQPGPGKDLGQEQINYLQRFYHEAEQRF